MKRIAPAIAATFLLLSCATPPSAPDLQLLDLDGNEVNPLRSDTVSVFVFTRTDCPISNRYAPEIRRIYERFEPQGVAFWLVYVDPDESENSGRSAQCQLDGGTRAGARRRGRLLRRLAG